MRRIIKSIIIGLLSLVGLLMYVSCSRYLAEKKTLARFEKEKIVIPQDLICISEGTLYNYVPPVAKGRFCIIYDSLTCSVCNIAHLEYDDNLYSIAKQSGKFDVLIIFVPRAEESSVILKMIIKKKHKNPVLLDTNGSFFKNNPKIPMEIPYHYFLVNQDGFPIFVGDPNSSKVLFELFNKAVHIL